MTLQDDDPREENAPLRPFPPAIAALVPVVLLGTLLLGTLRDEGWLRAHSVDAPPRPYDRALLEPRHRAFLRRDPPQGMALGVYSMDPSYDYGGQLAEIAASGAQWVELVVNHYQDRFDSSVVGVDDARTATPERVARTVAQAHALGLRVHLMPLLLLRKPRAQDWRGTIAPIEVDRWHRSYRAWIVEIARHAEASGVEALCIGSELNSRQGEREPWLETIARVREVYGGAVTYSANWDSYATVSFIEALDGIGMTTYFELSRKKDPTREELISTWLPLRSELTRWQRENGVPLIFTEVGYPSIDGAAMHPWDYTADGPIDLEEQRDCLEAFVAVWRDVPELTGVFFFVWWDLGGPLDRGYTTRGKPAHEVIERWFRHRAKSPGRAGTD